MDYLARNTAPFSAAVWSEIDSAVVETARKFLVCRRFLKLFGPLGSGASFVAVDGKNKKEVAKDGFIRTEGRKLMELPQLYEDFTLLWRDIEEAEKNGLPLDLSPAVEAAQRLAWREDELVLKGSEALGTEGIWTCKDAIGIKKGDWKEEDRAYKDVAEAVIRLTSNGKRGRLVLVMSPDLYMELQRVNPELGVLELDRISALVGGHIYAAGIFGEAKAALLCAEPRFMDLAIGADFGTGYLALEGFNHQFRILETAALRIKDAEAIVNFE